MVANQVEGKILKLEKKSDRLTEKLSWIKKKLSKYRRNLVSDVDSSTSSSASKSSARSGALDGGQAGDLPQLQDRPSLEETQQLEEPAHARAGEDQQDEAPAQEQTV